MIGRTWLPEAHYMPDMGQYRPLYRWYRESPWTLVPGGKLYPSSNRAVTAAKDWLAAAMNKGRAEQAPEIEPDVLGVANWRDEKAASVEREQVGAFGTIFIKGRAVAVEKRRARA